MPVKTWVGRFAIVEGQPQEEGPFLRSFPRQRPDEEEDELYVLAEPASPASKEHCGQLVDAIGRMYRQDTLSMTGAVLRALKAAHQQLRDWNERSLPEHRVGAGVSCLAVRSRTAYLAQVGPSVAYHVGDGRFHRIVPEDSAVEPLGRSEQTQPIFSPYQLSPGDLLLIASPRIDELVDEEALRSILMGNADEALVELFRLARDQQEFSLVLLACVVEPETEGAPAEPAAPPGEQPAVVGPPPLEAEPAPAEAPYGAAVADEEPTVAAPPTGLSQPKLRLKGAEAEIRYPRTTGLRATLPRVPPLAIVAVLVVAAVGLLAWCVIPSALQESREDQFAALVDEARVALDLLPEDPGERRESLRAADAALLEAEGLRADEPEVTELRAQVEAALAELNAVLELPELDLIVDVSERVPGAVSPKDLALGGGGAYFLDREQQRVIAISLLGPNPEPFVLFEAGELVGTEIAGSPQHIAWAEELESVLILDDARRLIALTPPGQPRRLLTVRDSQAWGSADGIAYADGILYVLDGAGDQIWRYLPSESGFDSEREPLLASFDLEQVVELAIGDALYLVMGDDTIWRFQGRVVQPLTPAGIDRALASPASLVPLPASGRLLVADRGNKRIVVFSPDGTFRQQLVSPTITADLRAIAIDEPGGLLYILVGGALYRTQLPSPPPQP
jgi:serine/threonine protein phosphatase PrpC